MHIPNFSRTAAIIALAAFSFAAHAVTNKPSSSSYLVTHKAEVPASPAAVFAAIGQIDKWWTPRHTYSGKPENLKIDMRAGGCFCEAWDGNSVEHAHVVQVQRDHLVRMEGGLGPLQEKAVSAILTFVMTPDAGKTRLVVTYRVRAAEGGLDASSDMVDLVIGEQVDSLVAYLNKK